MQVKGVSDSSSVLTRQQYEDLIVSLVESGQGLKCTQLASEVTSKVYEQFAESEDLPEFVATVEKLVAEGRLIEIEYVLQTMPYRVKSFVLPGNTEIVSVGGKK